VENQLRVSVLHHAMFFTRDFSQVLVSGGGAVIYTGILFGSLLVFVLSMIWRKVKKEKWNSLF
jgi:hypothetical protein